MQGYGKVYCASAVVLSYGSFDSGQCRRQSPLETHGLPQTDLGKLFGDSGYISKDLFEQLFIDGVHLVTRLKKGMKNALML